MQDFSFQGWLKQPRIVVSLGMMAIALTACSVSPSSQTSANPITSPTTEPATEPSATLPSASSDQIASRSAAQSPDNADSSQQAAVQVIRDYYQAIARQDYARAYSQWDAEGRASGQSFDQFKQGFVNTASTTVEIGEPGSPSGAAGSVYMEIPVTITAKTTAGISQKFHGSYVLKRVNDVPGSTPAQRRWHLYSADIASAG